MLTVPWPASWLVAAFLAAIEAAIWAGAVGGRLAAAAGRSAAALQAIAGNPSVARQHIAATAVTAREALGEVREVATRYRDVPWPEAAPADPGELRLPGSRGPSSW